MNFTSFLIPMCLMVCTGAAASDPIAGAYFVRGAHGDVSIESKRQLNSMIASAARNKSISVWITFGVFFAADPTAEEAARTHAEVATAYDEIVAPFVRAGTAQTLETPKGLENAPGRLVSISARALRLVARHDKVKQIAFFPTT